MSQAALFGRPSNEIDTINLSRALSRLEKKILSPTTNQHLQHSSYERKRTAANLEYARTLLLRLEHSTSTLKIQSRKQAAQSSLLQQRNLIKQLNDRLYELGQQDDGTYSDSSMEEDILAEYISPSRTQGPAPSDPSSPTLDRRKQSEVSLTSQSVLRNRNDANPSRPATTTAHTLHSSLQSATTQSNPEPSSTQILEASSTTQADLTSSLLTLAAALKASSLSFQSSLDAEKALLESTSSSLDKNADGMQAAEKRMGMLRRMSEGKGWLGRMMLYAWIGGLWIVAILLVFVGPKLRF